MGCFLLAVFTLGFARCQPPMKATADCAYDVGTKASRSWGGTLQTWDKEPSGKCAFHLEAPVKKAKDAAEFGAAFEGMFRAMPVPEGVRGPEPTLEKKVETK